MEELDNGRVLIIKGRFKSPTSNLYGLLLAVINSYKKLDTYMSIVSTYSDLYNFDLDNSWISLEDILVNLIWKGNYNKNISASIIDQFKAISDDNRAMTALYENTINYDYDNLEHTIFSLISRIIHDNNMTLEIKIQDISSDEFNRMRESRGKPKEEPKNEIEQSDKDRYQLGDEDVILPVKPILSPVKGKPIYDLKIGDRIMIKISRESQRAEQIIDLLQLREGNTVHPAPAAIVDIKAGSGKNDLIQILTSIGSGVYGKFEEEEKQVKLKMYSPENDGPLPSMNKNKTGSSSSKTMTHSVIDQGISRGTVVLMTLLIFILVIFIFFIMILL